MKVAFISDSHVDMGSQPPIQWPECDVLVIAGDTANTIGDVIKLLNQVTKRTQIPHILVVDGNHEHYSNEPQGRTVQETLERLRSNIEEQFKDRCHFLPSLGAFKYRDRWFIGRNGWYSFDSSGDPIANRAIWKNRMNDNRWVGFDRILQPPPWELAEVHAQEIREMLATIQEHEPDAHVVVVTHTAPHRSMLHPDPRFLETNPFYVNTRMEAVLADYSNIIDVWVHGHTHFRSERVINDVYVLANPRGYPGENPNWEPVVLDL